MSTSPAYSISATGQADDVFERLARCDRLLTAKELADILAISPKTLYNYVTRGMIPYFKIESNVRFRAREVAEWLRQHSGRPGGLVDGSSFGYRPEMKVKVDGSPRYRTRYG